VALLLNADFTLPKLLPITVEQWATAQQNTKQTMY